MLNSTCSQRYNYILVDYYIPCNVAPDPILTNGGIALEEVEDFKYLGSWVNSSERDIKTRKALAWKALNNMKRVWKSNVSNELKTRLFIATVESVLLYGCESWTFTSAQQQQQQQQQHLFFSYMREFTAFDFTRR